MADSFDPSNNNDAMDNNNRSDYGSNGHNEDSIGAMSEPSSDPDGELRMLYQQSMMDGDDDVPLAPAVELKLNEALSSYHDTNLFFGHEHDGEDSQQEHDQYQQQQQQQSAAKGGMPKEGTAAASVSTSESIYGSCAAFDASNLDGKVNSDNKDKDNDTSSPIPAPFVGKYNSRDVSVGSAITDTSLAEISTNALPETTINEHGTTNRSRDNTSSFYGRPLSPEKAKQLMPLQNAEQGLTWLATILPDDCFDKHTGRVKKGLPRSVFDTQTKTIKPRRSTLPMHATEFLSSLTEVQEDDGSHRYIFHGVLNGWPSLTTLEVLQVEQQRGRHHLHSAALPTPKQVLTGQWMWITTWRSDEHGAKGIAPTLPNHDKVSPLSVYRVTFRGPPWSSLGWSPVSPGYCFWYQAVKKDDTGTASSNDAKSDTYPTSRFSYGTNILQELSDQVKCTHIHMLSHRYAVPRESPRDRLTYHSACLLEWDHGEYCTVVEAAYLNGIGGYKGRSNWYHDRDEPMTELYKSMPPEMVSPWRTKQAEIRCYDIFVKSLDEFQDYVNQYIGPTLRFIDPHVSFSHPARLTFRSRRHIAQYFINYISRDTAYAQLKRNCQTFTADLCSFLAGKKDIVPFHPVSRVDYQNRTYLFLYDSNMYQTKEEKKRRQSSIVKSQQLQ